MGWIFGCTAAAAFLVAYRWLRAADDALTMAVAKLDAAWQENARLQGEVAACERGFAEVDVAVAQMRGEVSQIVALLEARRPRRDARGRFVEKTQ